MTGEVDWSALCSRHQTLSHLPTTLKRSVHQVAFEAGDLLFRLGERPSAVLYLVSGEIRLTRRSTDGAEVVLQRSRSGFFAEASMESDRYHCDGVASESGELLRFPVAAFREAVAHNAEFRNAWLGHLMREVRRLRAQCERLSLNGAAARVLHYIETEGTNGTVVLSQTKKVWAAELGLSHEALYRTLRKLQQKKEISVDGPRISRA